MSVLTNDQVAALDSAFIAALGSAGVRLAGVFSLGGIVNTVGGGSSSDISLTLSQASGTALSIQPGAYMALDGTTPGSTPSHGFQYNAGSGNLNLVGANLNVSSGFGFFGSSLQAASFMQAGAGRTNQLTMDGSATTVATTITASGTDTDVGISLVTKGAGVVHTSGPLTVGGYLVAHSNVESDNGVFQASGATSSAAALVGYQNDGASAVATILDNNVALANPTAKLVSVRNNGAEKAAIDLNGKFSVYGNAPTAGQGVSPVRTFGTLLGYSANGSPVASYTPPASAGIYEIGGWLEVTAWTSGNVGMTYSYKDISGITRSDLLVGFGSGFGNAVATINNVGTIMFFNQTIWVDSSSTPIELITAFSGTATVNFAAWVRQIQ